MISTGSPQEKQHIAALTGLRGLAAMWVFVYHAWVLAGPRKMLVPLGDVSLDFTPLFSCGWAGVQIFFVLSGFLLGLPFAEWQAGRRDKPRIRKFLLRRILRVFPAYYVQLLILLLLAYATTGQSPIHSWQSAIRHLFMLFVPIPLGNSAAINGVWWTLPIEFSFYLVLPALAVLMRPERALWLAAISLSSMVLWRYGTLAILSDASLPTKVSVASQLPGSLDSFGIGMIGAVIHVNWDSIFLRRLGRLFKTSFVPILAAAWLLACLYWIHWHHTEYWTTSLIFFAWTPLFCLALLLVVLASATGNTATQFLLANRVVLFLGTVSYSVYLWHFPILEALGRSSQLPLFDGYLFPALFAAAIAVTLPVAALSYRFVERPGQDMLRYSKTRSV